MSTKSRRDSSCLKHVHCGLKDIYLKLHRFLLFQIGRTFIGRAETPPETCFGLDSQKRIEGMYKLKRRKWVIQENKYDPSLLHYTAGSKYHWCQIQIRLNLTFPTRYFHSQLQQKSIIFWNLGGWAAHLMISQNSKETCNRLRDVLTQPN